MSLRSIAWFVATGAASTAAGLGLWFSLIGLDALSYFLQASGHTHQHGFHPISLVASSFLVGAFYGLAFFTSAALVARRGWSSRPAGATAFGYAAFLAACIIPSVDWTRGPTSDYFVLALPLLTAPFGAIASRRLFTKSAVT